MTDPRSRRSFLALCAAALAVDPEALARPRALASRAVPVTFWDGVTLASSLARETTTLFFPPLPEGFALTGFSLALPDETPLSDLTQILEEVDFRVSIDGSRFAEGGIAYAMHGWGIKAGPGPLKLPTGWSHVLQSDFKVEIQVHPLQISEPRLLTVYLDGLVSVAD